MIPDEVKRGIHVAIPFFLGNLRGNVDILVLSFAVSPSTVGNYGAASRIVQASQVTLWAFNRIMYPKLVAGAADGHRTLLELAYQQAFVMTALGGVTSVGLYIISPYAAAAFGPGFVDMADYLKILCWIVLLVGIQSVAFDALAALERHALRASIANICSVVGVGLVAGLTFSFGMTGTFVAIFATLTVSLASMWIALLQVTNCLPFKI
jgi:O-antigen/teichoic acid export membrane protein